MHTEPIIFLTSAAAQTLADALRQRYDEGYRILAATSAREAIDRLTNCRDQGEQVAVIIYEQPTSSLLEHSHTLYPDARRLILSDDDAGEYPDAMLLQPPWTPAETRLYPVIDELLAEWRATVEQPFARVKGIMTVRAVRIRIDDSLQRAAEIIALSGVGDLMVIDTDNHFVGVLSVGDVLRAAMPDVEEIMGEGGTLEQAFQLFLRKGSELMYKPIAPLVITSPLVVDPDDHVAKAAALMLEKNIHRLPVVKEGRLVGTVGRADICQAVVGTL